MSQIPPKLGDWAADADYSSALSNNPASVGVKPKSAFGGLGSLAGPKGAAVEMGVTALSGIFQARAAERARKQNLKLMRDQSGMQVEQTKSQLQQQILGGLSNSLAQIMMSRANARAV